MKGVRGSSLGWGEMPWQTMQGKETQIKGLFLPLPPTSLASFEKDAGRELPTIPMASREDAGHYFTSLRPKLSALSKTQTHLEVPPKNTVHVVLIPKGEDCHRRQESQLSHFTEQKPEAENSAQIPLLLSKPLSNKVLLPGHPSTGHLSLVRGQTPF